MGRRVRQTLLMLQRSQAVLCIPSPVFNGNAKTECQRMRSGGTRHKSTHGEPADAEADTTMHWVHGNHVNTDGSTHMPNKHFLCFPWVRV
eukprot:11577683-Prorocentrum_lima.AAC.1